jgi:molybdopterin converting factor small subunit
MAVVRLRPPLSDLAGGQKELRLAGSTVAEVLGTLEREHPPIAGWILDEQGRIRRHVNVFVNKERGQRETAVGPDDRVQVLPAISGGSE